MLYYIKKKYSIFNKNIYNFNETGFIIGIISAQSVVTASDRQNRPKGTQPGNREWATVIQRINACGWAIPPFVIFAGKNHLSAWYEGDDIPPTWHFAVSETG